MLNKFIINYFFSQFIDNEESQEPTKRRNRLGLAGLALHYANIISQIDTLVSSVSTGHPVSFFLSVEKRIGRFFIS